MGSDGVKSADKKGKDRRGKRGRTQTLASCSNRTLVLTQVQMLFRCCSDVVQAMLIPTSSQENERCMQKDNKPSVNVFQFFPTSKIFSKLEYTRVKTILTACHVTTRTKTKKKINKLAGGILVHHTAHRGRRWTSCVQPLTAHAQRGTLPIGQATARGVVLYIPLLHQHFASGVKDATGAMGG